MPPQNSELSEFVASKIQTRTKIDLEEALHTAPAPPGDEFVVQSNGEVRHVGATGAHGPYVKALKQRAEQYLYVFCKTVLRRGYLIAPFHVELCAFVQGPQKRKGCQAPRETGKSTIFVHGLPLHIQIQPKEHNVYFPGESGLDQRIMIAGENIERLTADGTSNIKENAESNDLLRALWPFFWQDPRNQAARWTSEAMVFDRPTGGPPGPSIRAVGVGAAIAGAHPSVIIKDDTFTFEAANSESVADWTIRWHIASRGLINRPSCLEFIDGTRWAVHDLYSYIMDNDPSVEWYIRSLVEDGKSIYPRFTWDGKTYGYDMEDVIRLKKEWGVLFPLLYMNSASDPELCDFSEANLRYYEVHDDVITIKEDARDLALAEIQSKGRQIKPRDGRDEFTGQRLTPDMLGTMARRANFLRAVGG